MAKGEKQRKLTEKEKLRAEKVERLTEDLKGKGYIRENVTVSASKATVIAIVCVIPFILIFGGWYLIRNGFTTHGSYIMDILIIVFFLLSIPVHEGLHGLVWGIVAPSHFHSVSFGFIPDSMAFYCSCSEPIKKWEYFAGLILPFLVLGIIPCFASIFIRSLPWLTFGLVSILVAGGDLAIIWNLIRYKEGNHDIILLDHPTDIGFIVFKK